MISVNNVVKRFGSFAALDGLTMTVPEASVYALVGPNGAGKSTIIRHITGAYRQDSGEILLDGCPIYENPAVKRRIISIPDELFFFMQASTRDMAKYYEGVYGGMDKECYKKIGTLFTFDDKRPMRQLSKGMQKQAAFRIALSLRPEVLVLDEPVDGLDPVMRRQVWSLVMGEVAERGMTVLLSSHNLKEMESVCDHVGIMHKGRLLLERSISELQDNICKAQLVLSEGETLPEGLGALHVSHSGRIITLIMRGTQEEISQKVSALRPVFFDLVPLTLEEIFIYELGGADYALKDILL